MRTGRHVAPRELEGVTAAARATADLAKSLAEEEEDDDEVDDEEAVAGVAVAACAAACLACKSRQ